MSREAYCEEWHDGKIVALHTISYPEVSEPGFYRQVTSLSAFRTRELKPFRPENWVPGCNPNPDRFTFEWGSTQSLAERKRLLSPLYEGAKTHYHTSVWEFYKVIHYDYKTQKYGPESYRSKK